MISADRPAFLAYNIVLGLHIAAGFIGMYGGLIPVFSLKGGRDHRQWGRLFTYAMGVASLSAFPLAWWRHDLFQAAIGLHCGYLTFFGFRVLRRPRPNSAASSTLTLDWAVAAVSMAAFLVLAALGAHFAWDGASGDQAVGRAALVFGALGVSVAARDVRSLVTGDNSSARRILDHLVASSLALLASVSAFLNTQFERITTLNWPIDQKMLLPLAVGLPFLLYWANVWRRRLEEQEHAMSSKSSNPPVAPMPSELKRLRLFALAEGISFLLLLFVAVPLKRIGGDDTLVRLLGPVHGAFFVLYVLSVLMALPTLRWRPLRIGAALAAAVLPFGTFVLDAHLRREHQRERHQV